MIVCKKNHFLADSEQLLNYFVFAGVLLPSYISLIQQLYSIHEQLETKQN